MSRVGDKIYNLFMAPIELNRLKTKREQLLLDVAGDVLEIGFGTGANLEHYQVEQLDSLTLMDTKLPVSLNLKGLIQELPIQLIEGDVQSLPFEDQSFDSVVFTLVFCTVENPMKGMNEIKRVLKPGGRIYFIEHVLPVRQPYKKWFKSLTPTWKKMSHGCHLNRNTTQTIQQAGFQLIDYHRFYRTAFVTGIGKIE